MLQMIRQGRYGVKGGEVGEWNWPRNNDVTFVRFGH